MVTLDAFRLDRSRKGRDSLMPVCVVLLLAPAFFCQSFFNKGVVQTGVMALAVFALVCICLKKDTVLRTGTFLGWIAFYTYTLANMALSSTSADKWFFVFGLALCAVVVLASLPWSNWIDLLFGTICAMALFHAVVTIVCWLVPGLYGQVVAPFFAGVETHIEGAGYRSAFTSHYSTNGTYLAWGFVASIYYFLRTDKNVRPLCLSGIFLFALVLTEKRAHLVFALAAFLFAYLAYDSNRGGRAAVRAAMVFCFASFGAAFLLLIGFEGLSVFDRFQSVLQDKTLNGRLPFYQTCLGLFSQYPVFGAGWDSFTVEFLGGPYAMGYLNRGFTDLDAHNVFLQVVAEEGIVGLALFLLACGAMLFQTLRALVWSRRVCLASSLERLYRSALAGSFALQLFFVMYCVTGNPLYDIQTCVPYLLSCAIPLWIMRNVPRVSDGALAPADRGGGFGAE